MDLVLKGQSLMASMTGPGQQREPNGSASLASLLPVVASTIADMDLPPHELAQVEEAFIGAGLL